MLKLGQVQTLIVVKKTDIGIYLSDDAGAAERVLLPKNQTPADIGLGNTIEVFLYKDSEDRLIATTTVPPLTLGGLAVLPVKEVTPIGAFLGWGLAKDLLLPFKEQTSRVNPGDEVLVTLYIDKSERLCATMKVYTCLATDAPYQKDDRVTGVVYEVSPNFGAFVAVDNRYSALIPKNELFSKLTPGDHIEARVASVKPDGKLDLTLREKSYLQMDSDAALIYGRLVEAGGFLPYHDKSGAEEIKEAFNLSKNAFKRAVGRLLKEGKIELAEGGIRSPGKKDGE